MTMMALTTLMLLTLHFLLGGAGGTVTAEIHFEYFCWRRESHPIKERCRLFCLDGKWAISIGSSRKPK